MIKRTKVVALVMASFLMGNTITSCGSTSDKDGNKTSVSKNEAVEKVADTKDETNKGKTVYLTAAEFKEKVFNYETNKDWKYEGSKPCIIDFYADWCGPCKMIAPILEDLALDYKDDIIIYKINTEQERDLTRAFGISSLPTLLFIPANGQPQMVQGALPKESFVQAINEVLLKK